MMFKYVCEDDLEWTKLDLRRGSKKERHNTATTLVSSGGRRKIKKEKFNDLQSLKSYIPAIYHSFYDSLSVEGSNKSDPELDKLPDEELYVSEDEEEEDFVI